MNRNYKNDKMNEPYGNEERVLRHNSPYIPNRSHLAMHKHDRNCTLSRAYQPVYYQKQNSFISRNLHNSHCCNFKNEEQPPWESVAKLKYRLKNIHIYYKLLLYEYKAKNAEKGEVVISLIRQLEKEHSLKVEAMKKTIEESVTEKGDVGFVDQRMNYITGSIDSLIAQSEAFKAANEYLEYRIRNSSKRNRYKYARLYQINAYLIESRKVLESFEMANLKKYKIHKYIMQMFDSVQQEGS